jgi:hypothetical protein
MKHLIGMGVLIALAFGLRSWLRMSNFGVKFKTHAHLICVVAKSDKWLSKREVGDHVLVKLHDGHPILSRESKVLNLQRRTPWQHRKKSVPSHYRSRTFSPHQNGK